MREAIAWVLAVMVFGMTFATILLDIRIDSEPQRIYFPTHSQPDDCWDLQECED